MLGIRFKLTSFLVLILFATGIAQAQDLKGVVTDSTDIALPSATVVILSPADSSLVKYAIANGDGEFTIKRVDPGDYILQITFVGFETLLKDITVGSQDLDVGRLALMERVSELDALVISADRIPIQVSGDTLEFNAAAFGVRPNAAVEELLRRLPGVEIAEDGSITAGGETVQNVLVDGKEFFGTDTRIATKNLPADAVDKVQVYDKKSEKAEFTGVDDGEREKTINLELKDDARRGYFGDVSGGYGNEERYEGRASINHFSPSTQLSFIGNFNNVNAGSGFNGQSFGGGASFVVVESRAGGGGGSTGGVMETLSGGLNLGHDFSGKTDIRGSYNLTNNDSWQDRTVRQQQLLGANLAGNVLEFGNQTNNRLNHALDFNLRHEFAEGHDMRFRVRGTASTSDGTNDRTRKTSSAEGDLENRSVTNNNSSSDQTSGSANLTYRRRLNEKGLSVIAEGGLDLNNSDASTDLNSVDTYYVGDAMSDEELHQLQESMTDRLTQTEELTISQPIGTDKMIEIRGEHRLVSEDQNRPVYDRIGGTLELNNMLSSGFDRSYRYLSAGLHFRQGNDILTYGVGFDVQQSDLTGDIQGSAADIKNGYTHILPTANMRYSIQQGMYLNLNYRASTREPSLTELQPFEDNTDPVNTYVGNPNLEPQYSHNLNLFYTWFDQFSFTNVFAFVNATYTKNAIVRSRQVLENFRQSSTSVNADGNWSVNASLNYGTPLQRIGAKISASSSAMFSRSVEFINDAENETHTMRNALSLTLENRNKDIFDIRATARYSFNKNEYSLNPQLNQNYLNRTYSANGTVYFGDNWQISSSLDYQLYSKDVFGEANSVPLWQASITRFFMNRKAEVQFAGLDLLDNNVGINYTNTAQYIQEEQINAIGQYFMLKFTWHLSPLGGGGKGAVRIMRD